MVVATLEVAPRSYGHSHVPKGCSELPVAKTIEVFPILKKKLDIRQVFLGCPSARLNILQAFFNVFLGSFFDLPTLLHYL